MLGKFEAVVDSINHNDASRPSDLAQLCSEKAHCKFPCRFVRAAHYDPRRCRWLFSMEYGILE